MTCTPQNEISQELRGLLAEARGERKVMVTVQSLTIPPESQRDLADDLEYLPAGVAMGTPVFLFKGKAPSLGSEARGFSVGLSHARLR